MPVVAVHRCGVATDDKALLASRLVCRLHEIFHIFIRGFKIGVDFKDREASSRDDVGFVAANVSLHDLRGNLGHVIGSNSNVARHGTKNKSLDRLILRQIDVCELEHILAQVHAVQSAVLARIERRFSDCIAVARVGRIDDLSVGQGREEEAVLRRRHLLPVGRTLGLVVDVETDFVGSDSVQIVFRTINVVVLDDGDLVARGIGHVFMIDTPVPLQVFVIVFCRQLRLDVLGGVEHVTAGGGGLGLVDAIQSTRRGVERDISHVATRTCTLVQDFGDRCKGVGQIDPLAINLVLDLEFCAREGFPGVLVILGEFDPAEQPAVGHVDRERTTRVNGEDVHPTGSRHFNIIPQHLRDREVSLQRGIRRSIDRLLQQVRLSLVEQGIRRIIGGRSLEGELRRITAIQVGTAGDGRGADLGALRVVRVFIHVEGHRPGQRGGINVAALDVLGDLQRHLGVVDYWDLDLVIAGEHHGHITKRGGPGGVQAGNGDRIGQAVGHDGVVDDLFPVAGAGRHTGIEITRVQDVISRRSLGLDEGVDTGIHIGIRLDTVEIALGDIKIRPAGEVSTILISKFVPSGGTGRKVCRAVQTVELTIVNNETRSAKLGTLGIVLLLQQCEADELGVLDLQFELAAIKHEAVRRLDAGHLHVLLGLGACGSILIADEGAGTG